MLGPPFPVVHNHLLSLDYIEGEVVVLAPHSQVSDLLPIGCLIVVGDQAVVSSANLMMVLELCLAMQTNEQGVQEGTEHAPLRGNRVEDQHGGCVVTYPYHLGAARHEVQDPVAEGGVLSQAP